MATLPAAPDYLFSSAGQDFGALERAAAASKRNGDGAHGGDLARVNLSDELPFYSSARLVGASFPQVPD